MKHLCNNLFCFRVLEYLPNLLGYLLGGFPRLEVVAYIVTVVVHNVPYFGLAIYNQFATYTVVTLIIQCPSPWQVLDALLFGIPPLSILGECIE